MLNFQLQTEKDRVEAARIDKRRAFEEERKKRIFNPRQRLYGIDYDTLQMQIDDKKRRLAEEKRIQIVFQEQMQKNGHIALALERKQKEEQIKVEQEINKFRQMYQRPEDRREFDLNDPNLFLKMLPARTNDDDPRLGPSSAQKFEGEDLVCEQRLKLQKEQFKAWLDQQLQEKQAAEKQRKIAEEAYDAAIISRDQRALELDNLEKDCRKKLHEACLKFNKALADERRCEIKRKERENLEDNLSEMYNNITSDLLTENPAVSQSNLGPGRQIGYLYKGMTPEEKENFRLQQLKQIEEQRKSREAELRINREYDDYFNGTQKTIYLMDKELEREHKERLKKLAAENLKLAEEQKKQKEYIEKIVFTNRPTAAYFNQFNKSTR